MKLSVTLRTGLVLLMLLAIVPLLGMSLFDAVMGARDAETQTTKNLEISASLVAVNQQQVANSARQVLTAISHLPDLVEGREPACQRYFKTLTAELPVYTNIGIIGADGYIRCHSAANNPTRFAGDRTYFQSAIAHGDFVADGYAIGRLSGKPIMTFALPIKGGDGNIQGVAFAAVLLSEVAKTLASVSLPEGRQVAITDHDGVVLATYPDNAASVGKPMTNALIRDAIKAGVPSIFDSPDASGDRRIYAVRPSSPLPNPPFFVVVSADIGEVLTSVRQQLALNFFALALIALLGSWMAWLLAKWAIVKPAAEILEGAHLIQAGALDVRLPVRLGAVESEFTRIARAFNSMADSIQHREQEQAKSYAELRQTQDRLLVAQKLGRSGHWHRDMRSKRLIWSDELSDLFGLKPGEFDGDYATFLKMIHPDDLKGFEEQRAAAYANGSELEIEYRIITPAGDVRWMHQRGQGLVKVDDQFVAPGGVVQDITQRREAEKALVDSEHRYAVLFEMAPVPMWVFDAVDYRFLTVNRAAVETYGYSADEFLSMTIFDIREESERAALRNQLFESTAPRQSWQHRRKDGSLLSVNVVNKPIQFIGRAASFVVAMDITAQVNAEKDVQHDLFTLQRAADAAQAITLHQTLDGMLKEVADQARGVIGAHQSVVSLTLGNDWAQASNAVSLSDKYAGYRDLRDPFDGSGIYAMVCENHRAVRMTQAELEAHPRWRNFGSHAGKHPPMRGWLAVPLTGRQGQNLGLLQLSDKYEGEFTLQDEYVVMELAHLASIAIENARLLAQVHQLNVGLEQKVADRTQALARQEALFRALAEQAPQVIWTVDKKGEANYFNRAFFDLVGGTLEDWTGRKWSSIVHPEDLPEVRENWVRAVANRSPYVGTRRLCGRDGSYHVMSYRALPVLDEHGEVSFWVGIDADITEIKSIESALRLSNQELETFSYSVSHDLRGPLNTIDGFSRLLAKQIASDAGSKAQHYLTRIQAGVAQMGKLIEDLLSLAQVSRMQLHTETVNLSNLSLLIMDEWQTRDPERKVQLHIEPGMMVQADAGLVRVLMENLLGNAWKFTSQLANANITVGQQPDAAGLPVFFVRDDGAGFDMAYADKLFVAFQRLHPVSEFPGTGVGLATVSRVIGRHGGQLWADASPGKGATFFFTLPMAQVIPPEDDVLGAFNAHGDTNTD